MNNNVFKPSLPKVFNAIRRNINEILPTIAEEELLRISTADQLNILWHLGHIVYANDFFLYQCAGLKMPLPAYFEKCFAPGTTPVSWSESPDVKEVIELFQHQIRRIEEDLERGVFTQPYAVEIVPGYELTSLVDVIDFNTAHEGFHFAATLNAYNSIKKINLTF